MHVCRQYVSNYGVPHQANVRDLSGTRMLLSPMLASCMTSWQCQITLQSHYHQLVFVVYTPAFTPSCDMLVPPGKMCLHLPFLQSTCCHHAYCQLLHHAVCTWPAGAQHVGGHCTSVQCVSDQCTGACMYDMLMSACRSRQAHLQQAFLLVHANANAMHEANALL